MTIWKLAPAIAILSLVGCGPPAQEVEAPALPDPDVAEPEADGNVEDDSSSDDDDVSDDDDASGASEPAEAQPRLPPHEPEKSCKGLPESTCKVTEGCAWSTTEDCIEHEAEP